MKKKNMKTGNYLERFPMRPEHIAWSADEDGIVTLDIENKGFFNRIAQFLFKKPKVSHIHLDKMGSFIWPLMDGEKDIVKIGEIVKEHFGEEAEPLYERLATFFKILDSYSFVKWNNE